MIENLRIQHFRGIRQCQLENLKQFNLFLGKNNCGKSSILDALFLFSNGNNPTLGLRINNIRNYIGNFRDTVLLNFYGLDTSYPIVFDGRYSGKPHRQEISFHEDIATTIDLSPASPNETLKRNYSLDIRSQQEGGIVSESSISVFDDNIKNATVSSDSFYKEIPTYYMPPIVPYEDMLKAYSIILKNKEEQQIIRILQQIEPAIKDMVVVDNHIMVDVGLSQRIPLEVMGDGIKKIFSIVLNIHKSQNGLLLLDEVDNGLHYLSMPVMWQAILYAAHECNTQICATTHNIDSLHSLNQVLSQESFLHLQDDISIYTLRKELSSGTLHALYSNYAQFNHLTEQNIEIR